MNLPLRIIQLSDIHLFADESKNLKQVNTEESFQSVLQLIKKNNEATDLFLLTGDLSQDGSLASYQRIARALKNFTTPVYWVPGNHDALNIMQAVYPMEMVFNDRHLIFKHWQMILLDSQKKGAEEGYLNHQELKFLEDCLKAYPNHLSIIVFHHQPISVGSKWIDEIGLSNADQLWEILLRYRNANTILFGHIHQEFKQVVNGINCLGSPSTCIQFKRKQDQFALENLPPGYRSIHLYDDGCMETEIKRIAKYVVVFNENTQ